MTESKPAGDAQGWRPIESAPKDEEVLVWLPVFGAACGIRGDWGWWIGKRTLIGRNIASMGADSQPTKWQPLPEQPEPAS